MTAKSDSRQPNTGLPNADFSETQFRLGRLLTRINRKLSEGRDLEKILDFIFESLNVIFPFDRISIALIEEEGSEKKIRAQWVKSKTPVRYLKQGYCVPLKGSSLEKILMTGKPRIINDLTQYLAEHPNSRSTELIYKDGMRSSLTCPLRAAGENIGVVFFSSTQPGTYKDEHVQTCLEIAEELSVLIEFVRLRQNSNNGGNPQNLRMILHDLRNPLSVIKGFIEVADELVEADADGEVKKIFSVLKRNTDYMLELLNEISELNKLNGRENHLELRDVDLRVFISELSIRGRELADHKEIGVVVETDSGLPQIVRLDPVGISRVLDNLLSNAIKFSERGTKIQVAIRYQAPYLRFEVTDEGPGIPNSEMPQLFREFGRTSVRPTEGESSTGLGLVIAKKIVEQHGGGISVKSQVGVGSTFYFWIPT